MASDFPPSPSFQERWINSDNGEEWIFNGYSWRRADFIHTLGDVAKDDLHFETSRINGGLLTAQIRSFDSTGAAEIELDDMEFKHSNNLKPADEIAIQGNTDWDYKDWDYAAAGGGIMMLGSKKGSVIYTLDGGNTWLDTSLQHMVNWNVGPYPLGREYDASDVTTYGNYGERGYNIWGISWMEQWEEFWVFWQTRYDTDDEDHLATLGRVGDFWAFTKEELLNPTGNHFKPVNGLPLALADEGSPKMRVGASMGNAKKWSPWRRQDLAPDKYERHKYPIQNGLQISQGFLGAGVWLWQSGGVDLRATGQGEDGYIHFIPTESGKSIVNADTGYNLDPIWEAAGFKVVADEEELSDAWYTSRWKANIANVIHIPDLDRIVILSANSIDQVAYSDNGGGTWFSAYMNLSNTLEATPGLWSQDRNGHFFEMSTFGLTSRGMQIFAGKQPRLLDSDGNSYEDVEPAQLLRSFDGVNWFVAKDDFGTYPNGKNRRLTAVTTTNGGIFAYTSSWSGAGGDDEKAIIWGSQDGENWERLAQVPDPLSTDVGGGGGMSPPNHWGNMVGDNGYLLTTWRHDDTGVATSEYNPNKDSYITDVYFRGNKILLDPEANRIQSTLSRSLNAIESRTGHVKNIGDSAPEFADQRELWYQPSTNTLHVRDSDEWVSLFQ